MMLIDNKYNIGDTVYLVTDNEQLLRIVTCLYVRENNILYELSCGTYTSTHYSYEMSNEKNILTSI